MEHPDFRGLDTKDWKLTDEGLAAYKRALGQFLEKQSQKRRPIPKLMQRRLANKWSLCATDGALKGSVGVGLSVLEDKNPVGALKPEESWYYRPIETLPVELQQISGDRTRRSCIKWENEAGITKTRLEVQWAKKKNIGIFHIDSGAIGYPSKQWVFTLRPQGTLRGWVAMTGQC